jgi:hypothetical protein
MQKKASLSKVCLKEEGLQDSQGGWEVGAQEDQNIPSCLGVD